MKGGLCVVGLLTLSPVKLEITLPTPWPAGPARPGCADQRRRLSPPSPVDVVRVKFSLKVEPARSGVRINY
jgi:hypothetical protein